MNGHEQIQNAFRVALGGADETRFEGAQYGVTAGWDSMAHMQLIAEIEATFDVMLNTDEVISLSSFERAQEILKTHGIDVCA
jgi:acyl carrier protein